MLKRVLWLGIPLLLLGLLYFSRRPGRCPSTWR